MTNSTHTRTGSRRSGDDYQDVMALEVMIEMLEHPDRYEWIQVEADDYGALDDIVALRVDGSFVVKQIKFAVNTEEDTLDWDYLLTQKKGKKDNLLPSLLQKWSSSIELILKDKNLHEASLISNRRASIQIRSLISPEGILSFDTISDLEIRKTIIEQIGNDSRARQFFANFHFYLDKPGITTYEEAVQRRFYSLGGKSEGWLNLKDSLRFWIRVRNEPPPRGLINLGHIRRDSLWNRLDQMPQNFEVPYDYVLPGNGFYECFSKEVVSGKQNCFVLYASPGVGKSTYLSYLYKDLKEKKIPIIRHHYFLSLYDRTPRRLEHERIAVSLMGEIMDDYPESLGKLAVNNPDPAELFKWVEASGRFFKKQGKSLVIVIDGLDHVWREQHSVENLDKLFEQLLLPPEGIVVLVGTQPIDDKYLPSRLRKCAPKNQWIRLPLLDKHAVKEWLRLHEKELDLPSKDYARENILDGLSENFFNKSDGHPLHLKYTLRRLIELDMHITEQNILSLPGCLHQDIISYYNELWSTLTEQSRQILHLFAATNFPWSPTGIIDCIDPEGHNLAQVNTDLKHIRHLMSYSHLGLQPFHTSLLEFIQNHEDYHNYAQRLKESVLGWLMTKAPSYWKWAYEWQVQSELGNPRPLINGITRNWCIESIAKRYPCKEANQLFTLGIKSVLDTGNLVELVRIGLLRSYYDIVYEYRDEIIKELFLPQLILNEDDFLMKWLFDKLESLPRTEIVQLAEHERKQGNNSIAKKGFEELNGRLKRPQDDQRHMNSDWETEVGPMIKTAALAVDEIPIDRFYNYICSNRRHKRSARICEIYAKELWASNNPRSLLQLLQKDLTRPEYEAVIKYAVFLGFEEDIDFKSEVQNPKSLSSPLAAIYRSLKVGDKCSFKRSEISSSIFSLQEHEQYSNRDRITKSFYDMFFTFLANHLRNDGTSNKTYINTINAYTWVEKFLIKLDDIASSMSKLLLHKDNVEYRSVYKHFDGFKRPVWPDDRDFHDYGFAAERALYQISFDLMIIGGCKKIVKTDIADVFGSNFCHPWSWIEAYIDRQRCYMDDNCFTLFLEQQVSQIRNTIEPFNERASHFAKLATLAAIHGRHDIAKKYVSHAATNLLTHGEHKDTIIFHVLDIIQACDESGILCAKEWLLKIAPVISSVKDFTDGDETNHLPIRLAEVISTVMPEALPRYYMWLSREEEYYNALSVFHVFIQTADLSNRVNQALAKTAVDNRSIEILSERANNGDHNAQNILENISEFLGGVEVLAEKDENESATTSGYHQENELPDPANYPPENLQEYFKESKAFNSYERGICLMPWLDYWIGTCKKDESFQAIIEEEKRGGRLGLENYDRLYEIALSLYGKSEAYPWLVKAHIERAGWSRYYTDEDEAIRRWEIVKRNYPDKWLEFIKDTMKSIFGNELNFSIHERVVRLVKYCIFMGQIDLAKKIAEQVVASVLELVSPIDLPMPEWLDMNEQETKE